MTHPTLEQAADADLGCLDADLDRLIDRLDVELAGRADLEVLQFARRFERFRNRLSLVDHQIVSVLESNGVAGRQSIRSTQRLLAQTVRIGVGEAKRRLTAAQALRPETTMTGEQLPIRRPDLAAAQLDGQVSAAQVHEILGCLDRLDRLVDTVVEPAVVGEAERLLTRHAETFDPGELRRCAEKIVECVNPDGVLADERAQQSLRELHLTPRPDGLYNLRGVLTPPVGAALQAVLAPLAAKRPGCPAEGRVVGADEREYPARMHDALADAAHRLLKSGELPMTGGVPATVLITVAAADLQADRGFGKTVDGTLVPVKRLWDWADEAETVVVQTTSTGAVLELGRQRRIATKNQTLALIARDGACTFPGCDHPPHWCDRHHILDWQYGGRTDVDNLTLLCRYHHRRFEQHGWTCTMIGGLPHWIPPRWVDREQQPILNERLASRHRTGEQPLPFDGSGLGLATGSVGASSEKPRPDAGDPPLDAGDPPLGAGEPCAIGNPTQGRSGEGRVGARTDATMAFPPKGRGGPSLDSQPDSVPAQNLVAAELVGAHSG